MSNPIFTGPAVAIPAVLANRDRRAATQVRLLRDHPDQVVVAAKLNIPGPVKTSPAIRRFFADGLAALEARWRRDGQPFRPVASWEEAPTGPERFYLLPGQGPAVKAETVAFEEATPANRLFDLDVLVQEMAGPRSLSRSDSGLPVRTCLICGRPAKECGRSRQHSVNELQARVAELILKANQTANHRAVANQLAAAAVAAMLSEVATWPKPGLVDPVEHGAHPDMDVFTFIQSAVSLRSYFYQAATLGINWPSAAGWPALFNQLRPLGVQAEQTMLKATAGVNTHKGTIFSLGILVAVVAALKGQSIPVTARAIQTTVRTMLPGLHQDFAQLPETPDAQLTAGERQYLAYGKGGIRAEAAAGFPTVFNHGLPTLLTAKFANQNDRQLAALLALARHTDDSTLVKRAGDPAILTWKDQQLDQLTALGGLTTVAGRDFLDQLQETFSRRHLSLGGAADLLILTIFLADVLAREDSNAAQD